MAKLHDCWVSQDQTETEDCLYLNIIWILLDPDYHDNQTPGDGDGGVVDVRDQQGPVQPEGAGPEPDLRQTEAAGERWRGPDVRGESPGQAVRPALGVPPHSRGQ